jgi:FG-GAP repeat
VLQVRISFWRLLHLRTAARCLLVAASLTIGCLSFAPAPAGAALSLTADPFIQQGEKLTSAEVKELAEQGASVALSANGDTALVGSPAYKKSLSEELAGAAWVYVRSGSTWTLQAKLVGSEGSDDAQQGHSVALSADGDTALIGGPEDEGEDEDYYGATCGRGGLQWPRRGGLKWPHFASVVVCS